jgi:VanZ family protein
VSLKRAWRGSGHRRLRVILKTAVLWYLLLVTPAFAIAPDKRAHYTGGMALGLGIGTIFYHLADEMGPPKRMAVSTGLALIPGIGIEIGDAYAPHNVFSWNDLLADALGAVTGSLAAELINGQFWISASGRQIRLIGHW